MNGPFGLSDLSNNDASDNLQVECRHVDGTMNAAVRAREMDWLTEGAGTDEVPVCRILTNARCLSEGVDVPTLDAVLSSCRRAHGHLARRRRRVPLRLHHELVH